VEPVKLRQTSRVMSAPRMVEKYLCSRGIRDPRVLGAMSKVPRERFVPEILRERAYSDHPLPIGHDQTISQPYIVAIMSQALELEGKEKILEIGTGSGYQTAILAELARSVFSVERIHLLTMDSKDSFSTNNYALQKHVIPTSPNSLYAYLQAIVLGLKGLKIEEKAKDIFAILSRLRSEIERLNEEFALVGRHLSNASSAHDKGKKRLERLQDRVQQIEQVDTEPALPTSESKTLPRNL